jgi:hypothetical protein
VKHLKTLWLALAILVAGCKKETELPPPPGTYSYDADFLKNNSKGIIELTDVEGKAKVLLSAQYQGRVMTSTASGDSGTSYGWINYDLISSGEKKKQFNPVGGEERFWLGPEGGQYSIYFAPKDSFSINKWQVPPIIDTISFDVVSSNATEAVFTQDASITNYGGVVFHLIIERKVSLLMPSEIESDIGVKIPGTIRSVAYRTRNTISNKGSNDWAREKGLLSIWLLGMMTPTDNMVVIIPFHPRANAKDKITTNYFGEIPEERLQVKDSVLFFTCDGKYRSKIGLPPEIAKPIAASFDFGKNVLTVIQFPVEKDSAYVNSKWEIQKEPYRGDVVNSYNDGPLADGSQLGPFYELESSSRAFELKKDETGTYVQSTYHFEGDFKSLNVLAKQILGVDLESLRH